MAKDFSRVPSPKGDGCLLAKVNAVRELQSTGGEELSMLMPSILDKAFSPYWMLHTGEL